MFRKKRMKKDLRKSIEDGNLLAYTLFNICLLEVLTIGVYSKSKDNSFNPAYSVLFINRNYEGEYDEDEAYQLTEIIIKRIHKRLLNMNDLYGIIMDYYELKEIDLDKFIIENYIVKVKKFVATMYLHIMRATEDLDMYISKIKSYDAYTTNSLFNLAGSNVLNKYISVGRNPIPMMRESMHFILSGLEAFYDYGVTDTPYDPHKQLKVFLGSIQQTTDKLMQVNNVYTSVLEKKYER